MVKKQNISQQINKMNKFFFPAIIILLLVGCTRNKIPKAIEIYFNPPILLKSGEVFEFNKEMSIYSFEDALVYELPFSYEKITDSIPINVKKFFIFGRGMKEGLMYIPALPRDPEVFKVDSILKRETLIDVGDIFTLNQKIFVGRSVGKDTIKEVYLPEIKKDISYPDTMVVSYLTKKIDLDYSLSKSIEKEKNKTVVKVNTIYNPTIIQEISFPRYTLDFELRVIDDIPIEQLKKYRNI